MLTTMAQTLLLAQRHTYCKRKDANSSLQFQLGQHLRLTSRKLWQILGFKFVASGTHSYHACCLKVANLFHTTFPEDTHTHNQNINAAPGLPCPWWQLQQRHIDQAPLLVSGLGLQKLSTPPAGPDLLILSWDAGPIPRCCRSGCAVAGTTQGKRRKMQQCSRQHHTAITKEYACVAGFTTSEV